MTRIVAAAFAVLGVASVGFGFRDQPYVANALHLKTRVLGAQSDDKQIEKNGDDISTTVNSIVNDVIEGAIDEQVARRLSRSRATSADGVLNDYLYNAERAMPYYEKMERWIVGGELQEERETAWAALWLRYAFKHTKNVLRDGASWEHQTNHKYEDYVTGDEIVEANNYIDDLLKKRDTLQKLDDGHEELERTDPANLKNFVLQGGGATWIDGEGYHKAGKPLFDLLTLKTGNGKEANEVKNRLEREVRALERHEESRSDKGKLGRTRRTGLLLSLAKETSTVYKETMLQEKETEQKKKKTLNLKELELMNERSNEIEVDSSQPPRSKSEKILQAIKKSDSQKDRVEGSVESFIAKYYSELSGNGKEKEISFKRAFHL